jgi:hypothetical protein
MPIMRRPKDVLRQLIDDLNAIADPAERGAAATETLEAVKDLNSEVAAIRQAAARELKEQGLTYKEIGRRFQPEGDGLHLTRIKQIIEGGPTGKWAKTAREAPPAPPPEGE